ncbi:MAG: hypothetical protein HUU01_06385 [Saprospiraceae bacterium]|nr:hypothetical protein [Saprospiraceae bacterium]
MNCTGEALARVTALLPVLVPVALSAGQSGVLFAFMANAAMGYCLTLPASAKPVAMFAKTDEETYSGLDLLRLSMWLLPLHFALFLGFYHFFQNLGLGLRFPAGI